MRRDNDMRGLPLEKDNASRGIGSAKLRHWLERSVLALLCFGVVLLLGLAGILAPLDDALRSLRFQASDRAPSGDTVFVDIDAASLATIGVWPWPRHIHAQIIERLMEVGAAEVVFDVDFSTASTEADDHALERALEQSGGFVLLAAFQQTSADGVVVLNRPLARFAQHSGAVLVNVDGDGTELLRSLPMSLAEPAIPSTALALVPYANSNAASLIIDYGIDLRSIQRISVVDLLDGAVNPALLDGKQVIVGASAIELRDFFRVPRFGVVPGAIVQLAGVETLKAERLLIDMGMRPAAILVALIALLLVFGGDRFPLPRAAMGGAAVTVLTETGALLLQRHAGFLVDTAMVQCGVVLFVAALLVLERAARWRVFLRQQARLVYLATHDPVSGALTQQALLDELDSAPQLGGVAGVAIVELGRLDGTIASLGHEIGDRLAGEVASRLEAALGRQPARLSLDLFAWPFDATIDAAQQTSICAAVAKRLDAPYLIDGHRVILDTRFGMVSNQASQQVAAGEMLRRADVALMHAREHGLKIAVFESAQSVRIGARRKRDVALRQALERGEFFLVFQPQHDLRSGAMSGVEALVRWRSESLGLVSPADFIGLAEETGLIVELGAWVLHDACRQAASWKWGGRLAVNVSSQQFRLGDIVATVSAALAASGLAPERLDLEITESLFVDHDPGIVAALDDLKRLGVGIALDDFGTGYSSLSYLARLPVDKIKIDQSFVHSLPDHRIEALVEAIVLMAKRLDKRLVAEGIETSAQRDYLASLGCDTGQGYLFAKPSSAEALGLIRNVDAA